MATPARQYHHQMVHFLRKSIVYSDTTATVGVIPSGALILKPASGVHVTTAFNGNGNKVIDVGTTADDDLYGTNLDVATTTFVALDEAVGTYLVSADTTIIAVIDSVTATAGAGEVVIAYIPDTDG